jgi:iron(III) transport system substrate-binding protein
MRKLINALALLVAGAISLGACKRDNTGPYSPHINAGTSDGEVVLYSSADTDLVKLITAAFEKDTGIKVKWVGDTEATKNTGLVQRLRAEKDTPRADVWWSSEPFATINLAKEGVFEKYTSAAGEKSIDGGWPAAMRAQDGTWYGFAQRARCVVYNTDRVKSEDVPHTLAALADARFKDRVGMARPRFGTTGGHMAAIAQIHGVDGLRIWLKSMKANGLRLYDGNASVMRAVANGEIHVGLTDTDDVWAGQRQAYPIEIAYEQNDIAANPTASFKPPPETLKIGWGPLVIPNMAALVKGGPNPDNARKLVDYLLSEKVERLLAESDSHNIPLHPKLAAEPAFAKYAIKDPMKISLEQVASLMNEALKVCDEVLRE